MKSIMRGMFVFVAFVFAAALVLQITYTLQPLAPTKPPHLAAALPANIIGFTVHDEPLGLGEFIKGTIEKTLNYDDYVNRIYRRGDLEISVYVAYWGPGKMPTRDIASHTPYRCWTDNGMTCTASRYYERVSCGPIQLLPADWREFTSPVSSRPIWVYFWLLADGELYDFGARFNALQHPTDWLASAWKNARYGRREHYFIRVTSNQPFADLKADQAYQLLLHHLGQLGLFGRFSRDQ